MCGIIGIISTLPVSGNLLDGLKRLEYRGYDSAGIATLENGAIQCRRAQGKLAALEQELRNEPLPGLIGIGHTRWATHGIPSKTNAHPHVTAKVAVVHNGIIENFRELKKELEGQGTIFRTETDTEVIPHLLDRALSQGMSPQEAVSHTIAKLEGAFALAILFAGHDNLLIAARKGSPLVIGYGEGEMYIGSDAYALAPFTSQITYLEEGDWAEISRTSAIIHDKTGAVTSRDIQRMPQSTMTVDKGHYRHFMLKEIYEQPSVISDTLHRYYNPVTGKLTLPALPFNLGNINKVTLIACGTSYYAGLVAKYWFESIAKIPVEIDIASEFRYRNTVLPENGLALCISQSGETADTLAALQFAKSQGQHVISVVNVETSSMARASDAIMPTVAGPEIGVASTKAFTTQLVTLACLVIATAQARGSITEEATQALLQSLVEVPGRAALVLGNDQHLKQLAAEIAQARNVLYIGRGTSYAVAMEGALKLKELSYIHAEGIAAGELKHGPIALIDEATPVIAIAPSGALFEKTASNMQEVAARGGKILFFSDKKGLESFPHLAGTAVELPETDSLSAPILYAIPVQLLAYHVAVLKGTDVDQPRNLAKSVTVE